MSPIMHLRTYILCSFKFGIRGTLNALILYPYTKYTVPQRTIVPTNKAALSYPGQSGSILIIYMWIFSAL